MIAPSLPPTPTHKTRHNARLCMESAQRDDLAGNTTRVLFSETFPEDQTWRRCQSQNLRKLSTASSKYKGCICVRAWMAAPSSFNTSPALTLILAALHFHCHNHWVLQGFFFFILRLSHVNIRHDIRKHDSSWLRETLFFIL